MSFIHSRIIQLRSVRRLPPLTTSELIAEEQTYNVDLDGNEMIGDDIERYLFLDANNPVLFKHKLEIMR